MAVVTVAEIRTWPPQKWELNNTALKSIRDCGEDPPGYPKMPPGYGKELFDRDPFPIQTLRRTKGMHYELVDPVQPWSWRGMLNGFSDPTLVRVVGPGITGICCMPMHGTYDHARRNAAKELGIVFDDLSEGAAYEGPRRDAPVPVWDFVVTRVDGIRVRFHPQLTTKKMGISDWLMPMERDGPAAGPGKSDGKGTFRRMQQSNYPETGRARTWERGGHVVDDVEGTVPSDPIATVPTKAAPPLCPQAKNAPNRGGGHGGPPFAHAPPDRAPDHVHMGVRGGGMADPTYLPNVPTKAPPPRQLDHAGPFVTPTFPRKAAPPLCPPDLGGDHRDLRPLPDHPPPDNMRADVYVGGHVQDVRGGGHPAPDPPPAKHIPADAPPAPAPGLNLDDVPNRCGEHPGALALERHVDPIHWTPGQGATDDLPRERQSWQEKFLAAEKQDHHEKFLAGMARLKSEHSQTMNDVQSSMQSIDEMD